MTNNTALVRGWNAKNGPNATAYRMSPKWVHNLVCGGDYQGAMESDPAMIAMKYGAPLWSDLDGTTTHLNYLSWNPGAELWESALDNKIESMHYVVVGTSNFMDNVRTLLLDGYVLSFPTYFGDWRIQASDSDSSEYICTSVHYNANYPARHMLTIVGYDDEMWTDVNSNGVIDEGEEGAFKIANSWGTNLWGTTSPHTGESYQHKDGYLWLAYDALNEYSMLEGADNTNRIMAFDNGYVYFLKPKASYTPLLLAEVTINIARRSQLDVAIGISPSSQSVPAMTCGLLDKTLRGCAFNDQDIWGDPHDENYNFTGGTTAASGTFTFDLTPIVKKYFAANDSNLVHGAANRFYIKISDSKNDSYPCVLEGFKIIDRVNNVVVNSSTTLPLTANNSTVTAFSGYTLVPLIVNTDKEFEAGFSYPIREETIDVSNFTVEDEYDAETPIQLSASTDRKTVTLTPPEEGYQTGNYYTLTLSTDILTDGGNSFGTPQKKFFYVP
jgi:hypothetical protein